MSEFKKIEKIIRKWAKENGVDLTDTSFYTAKEWKDRGEERCTNSKCTVATEGELNHILNMYESYHVRLFDSFHEVLEKNGYWFEMGTHWYFGVYRIEDIGK